MISFKDFIPEAKTNINHDYRSLTKEIGSKGWSFHKSGKEHDLYKHPKHPNAIAVPRHKGNLAPGTVRQILKTATSVSEATNPVYGMAVGGPSMTFGGPSRAESGKRDKSQKKKMVIPSGDVGGVQGNQGAGGSYAEGGIVNNNCGSESGKSKKLLIKPKNPVAQELRTPKFRMRVIKSKKIYNRKSKDN